ncbi:MAG TPA: mechanosensitive ion channel family protein [Acidimicrobiales bacterium]|nr:mechanosensitive ion channel family protein [Acidimicrobiales bacterium]
MTTLLAAEAKIIRDGLTAVDWIVAGAVLAIGIAAGAVLRSLVGRALNRGDSERAATVMVSRIVAWVAVVTALFWSLALLGVRLGPLFGAVGIGGVALAFAAQSILANFLASIILQVRRPFRRGDQIETNDCEGTVEDVDFRVVRLRTFDGEQVMVPCAEVLSTPIVNLTTLGRRRTTLEVGVAYDTDLEEARDVLLAAVEGAEGVLDRPPREVWVKEFDDSAVTLAVRFWHAPDIASLWRVRSQVAIAVRKALAAAGIEIPFPQRVLTFTTGPDGEPGLRGQNAEAGLRGQNAEAGLRGQNAAEDGRAPEETRVSERSGRGGGSANGGPS